MKRVAFSSRSGSSAGGFTLVEMLVGTAIFLLLIVILANLVTDASQKALRENQKMSSLDEARQSLDRLAMDWSSRVRREDVSGRYLLQPGSDEISFLSRVNAYNGTRRLASVAYRINPDTYVLERGILGYNWSATDPAPSANPVLTFPSIPSPTPMATPMPPAAGDYELLSDAVFRLESCFLRRDDGKLSVNTSLDAVNVAGVVVAMASLDGQTRKVLGSNDAEVRGALQSLAKALPDIGEGENPQEVWLKKINEPGFAERAGVPQRVLSSLRVSQRIYPVEP